MNCVLLCATLECFSSVKSVVNILPSRVVVSIWSGYYSCRSPLRYVRARAHVFCPDSAANQD